MNESISAEQLREMLDEQAEVCLIDVRRKADYDRSPTMIAGAVWHDPDEVADWGMNLPADREAIVYCVKGGQVSQSVAGALKKTHPRTRFLAGGILGWQEGQAGK